MSESVRTLVGFYLRSWLRTRGAVLWMLFLGAWAWFNWKTLPSPASAWWTEWSGIAAWLGFLSGYDTYARMREDGALRLILLHPPSRAALAVSLWTGACILVCGFLLLFLAFVGWLRPVPFEAGTVGAVSLTVFTGAAFAAYAQAASLVLPRDTAAVLGLLVVILGGVAPDRWLPLAAPGWIEGTVRTLHSVVPTSNRLNEALIAGGTGKAFGVLTVQVVLALVAITLLLSRTTLTRRPVG